MKSYKNLLADILVNGVPNEDRTGTGTISLFGTRMEFDLRNGFPLLTTKRVFWKGVVFELLWFLTGDDDISYLKWNGVHIWDDWAYNNTIGPLYGHQWVKWGNQLKNVINNIKERPNSRRHIVSAWNVDYLPDESISPQENVKEGKMALAPCHMMFQFYVDGDWLDLQMYQRSADMFLGVPFNIASYSLLLSMVAHVTGLKPRKFIWVGGDTHIYKNHLNQVKLQLSREPRDLPTLKLSDHVTDIFDFTYGDIELIGYDPHPAIKAPISV